MDFSQYIQYIIDDINGVEVTTLSSVYKLLVSMILGAVVGYERKKKGQNAGVRTFSLIAMGASLAMILSIYVPQEYLGLKNGDPGRIAAQVVTGIGFLGAGAIIQMKGSVRGLTTAAGIWMVAAIGMSVGVGMYWVSLIATVLILFILVQLERIEHRISRGGEARIIRIFAKTIVTDIEPYRQCLADYKSTLQNYFIEYDYDENITRLNLVVVSRENSNFPEILNALAGIGPVKNISVANQLSI